MYVDPFFCANTKISELISRNSQLRRARWYPPRARMRPRFHPLFFAAHKTHRCTLLRLRLRRNRWQRRRSRCRHRVEVHGIGFEHDLGYRNHLESLPRRICRLEKQARVHRCAPTLHPLDEAARIGRRRGHLVRARRWLESVDARWVLVVAFTPMAVTAAAGGVVRPLLGQPS